MVNRKTRRNKIVRRRNKSCCNKFKGGSLQGGTTPPPPPSQTARNTDFGIATMQRIDNLEQVIAALRVQHDEDIAEIARLNGDIVRLRRALTESDALHARQINNEPNPVPNADAVPVAMARHPSRSWFFGSRFRRGRVIPTATEIVGDAPAIARAEGRGTRNMKNKNKKKSEKKKGKGRK